MTKEWLEVNRIISKTSNYALAKEYNIRWLFIVLTILYLISSGIAIYFAFRNQHLISVLLIGSTLFIMQFILNNAFFKKYDDILKGLPRKQKLRYFKYLRFKNAFILSPLLKTSQIVQLLKWQDIEIKKTENVDFFETKLFIIPTTGLLAFVFGYFGKISLSSLEVTVLVILALVGLFIASSIFSVFTIGIHRQAEIKRSLEWLQLEHEHEHEHVN